MTLVQLGLVIEMANCFLFILGRFLLGLNSKCWLNLKRIVDSSYLMASVRAAAAIFILCSSSSTCLRYLVQIRHYCCQSYLHEQIVLSCTFYRYGVISSIADGAHNV